MLSYPEPQGTYTTMPELGLPKANFRQVIWYFLEPMQVTLHTSAYIWETGSSFTLLQVHIKCQSQALTRITTQRDTLGPKEYSFQLYSKMNIPKDNIIISSKHTPFCFNHTVLY